MVIVVLMEEVEVQFIKSTLIVLEQSRTFHSVTATTLQLHNHMIMMYGSLVLVCT